MFCMENFQKNIRVQLAIREWTYEDFCRESGISTATFTSYMGSSPQIPSLEKAFKIAETLDCTLDFLCKSNF